MPQATDLTFYEVAAQVIPVLFLALIVEQKLFGDSRNDRTPAFELFLLAIVLLAAVGEMVSIAALVEHKPPSSELGKTVVLFAMALLFLPFIVRAAQPRLQAIATAHPWSRAPGRVIGFTLLILLVVVTVTKIDPVPILAGIALGFFVFAGFAQAFESDLDRIRRRREGRSKAPERQDEHRPK
jgi:hypothetical protein